MISKIVDVLFRPSSDILLLCIVGFFFCLIRWTARFGRRVMLLGVASLLVAATPLGIWPLEVLESRFPEPETLPDRVDGIIVLGGAINLAISVDREQPTLKAGADRLTTFVALARHFPDAKLLFTGGGGSFDPDSAREADVARDLFGGLGLDVGRILFERNSRNTRENALFSKALARPRAGERWLLVTSAADMPRAVGCFRRVGWPVVAWPVGYRVARDGPAVVPSLPANLASLDWAAHEWMGLVYYWLQDWTSSRFPAPMPDASSTT